jgi:hypothetical protein
MAPRAMAASMKPKPAEPTPSHLMARTTPKAVSTEPKQAAAKRVPTARLMVGWRRRWPRPSFTRSRYPALGRRSGLKGGRPVRRRPEAR